MRNGIAILITFDLAVKFGFDATLFVQAGLALFMLPYFLFSAIAGQLADKYDKAILARWIKLFDLAAMVFGAFSLWLENPYMHLTVLFLAGTTAAFFGPIKYGVLPQYLKRDELIAGNALIELGTFVTILLGTMFGGFLVLDGLGRVHARHHHHRACRHCAGCAFLMPSAPGDQSIVFDWNVPRQTLKLLSYAREREDVFWSVIGASWFWFLGAAIMAQLPVFTRDVLLANDAVANAFIGLFTIGIGAGSLLTNALLKGEVSPRYVPIASIMMTVFLLDLYFAAAAPTRPWPARSLNHRYRSSAMARLARRRRSVLHRLLRRHLCRAAQRHHAAPFEPAAALARDRGQQRHERHLHDRLGLAARDAAEGHVAAGLLPAARPRQCRCLGLDRLPPDAGTDRRASPA